MTRRDFLHSSARWLLAGGLAAIGAVFAYRNRYCERTIVCNLCPAERGCELTKVQRRPGGLS